MWTVEWVQSDFSPETPSSHPPEGLPDLKSLGKQTDLPFFGILYIVGMSFSVDWLHFSDHLQVHPSCYIWHLIYPIVSGHLTCFRILGTVTSSALSFQLTAFSQDISRRGIAGSWGSLFWRAFIVFSILGTPIYIANNSVQAFLYLHILASIYLCSSWWWLFW